VPQDAAADYATCVEVDPCLSASAQYILAQDHYIMEVESQNRSLRDFQFQRDDVLAQEEWKRELVIHDLMKERKNSCKMEVLHESREKVLKAKIAELKDKVLEQELRNDYLSSQLLEYEDRIERQRRVLKEL
jgi:glutamate/tyrosine decarboxylase-like PLP-dependent enzyme